VLQEDALVQDFLHRANTYEVQNLEIISGRYGTVLRSKLQTMHQISFLTSYGRSTIGKYILESNQENT